MHMINANWPILNLLNLSIYIDIKAAIQSETMAAASCAEVGGPKYQTYA